MRAIQVTIHSGTSIEGLLATEGLRRMARPGRLAESGLPTLADLPMLSHVTLFSNQKKARAVFDAWIEAFGAECSGCGIEMQNYEDPAARNTAPDQITRDHIVARGLGGNNATANQRCVCRKCNSLKSLAESKVANHRAELAASSGLALAGILSSWCH